MPNTYKGYQIRIERLTQTKTRVLFKNVPIDCPEVEIINLCNAYGEREGPITRQVMTVPTESNGEIRMPTTTRVAMVKLHKNTTFKNYYWLGGLQPSSRDTKITGIHHVQTQQCANCLLTTEEGCPAMGVAKNCREMGTPHKSLSEYFFRLEEQDGYMSLRTQLKKLKAQEKGLADTTEYPRDDREDMDYEAEMSNLNKSGNLSPIKN